MESMTLQMPDGLLTKLHDVATRRGLSMGDAVIGLIQNFIAIDENCQPVEGHFDRPNGGR